MSVYEPFGISQLEPLASGAVCVVSNVCGCVDLVRHCSPDRFPENVLLANYIGLDAPISIDEALQLSAADREAVEAVEGKRLALEIMRRLPTDEAGRGRLLESGWELASRLDWPHVVEDIFLPAVRRTCGQDKLEPGR